MMNLGGVKVSDLDEPEFLQELRGVLSERDRAAHFERGHGRLHG